MQKQNDRGRFLLYWFIAWMAVMFLSRHFFPPPQAPEQTQSILAQAQQLEAEGRKEDSTESRADRIKKLEQAVQKYEEYYNQNKTSPQAVQVRFQQVNIYDYLARLEGKSTSTHWYDQAEAKLKDMEKAFHGRTGTVKLEEQGQVRTVSGDLSKIATERLNAIRAARDARNGGKLTYRILDFLVGLTGRNPQFSYFLALAFVVIFLKLITYPFQKKQYKYQQDMARVAPLLKELQEKMKGRPMEEIQKRQMQIYRENNVNIAAGCLPMLVTAFALFPVFWMVRDYEYQFTHGHFLWIGSEASRQTWWLGDNLAQFDVPLFIIYNVTLIASMMMQPKPADPQQAQQQKMMLIMMPAIFGVMMWMYQWSSAFMLYWLVLNVVSMYQSWVLSKQFPTQATASAAGTSASGGNAETPKPLAPLEPMKGVDARGSSNGSRSSGNGADGVPARVRPRRPGRRR